MSSSTGPPPCMIGHEFPFPFFTSIIVVMMDFMLWPETLPSPAVTCFNVAWVASAFVNYLGMICGQSAFNGDMPGQLASMASWMVCGFNFFPFSPSSLWIYWSNDKLHVIHSPSSPNLVSFDSLRIFCCNFEGCFVFVVDKLIDGFFGSCCSWSGCWYTFWIFPLFYWFLIRHTILEVVEVHHLW